MRKLVSLIHLSLDGFCAGPKGEMDWIASIRRSSRMPSVSYEPRARRFTAARPTA